MGKIIPWQIKKQVLLDWLKGLSRDNIAYKNQISGGTVSAIVKYFRSQIPDIDLLREVAIALRKKNLGLYEFARSMRLRNMLDYYELPEERIEKFLEHLCVFFYKHDDKKFEDFLLQVEFVSEMVRILDVSIYDILEEMDKKRAELKVGSTSN